MPPSFQRPASHTSPLDLANTLAQTTYVVVLKVKGKLTLLMDPGLGTPWRGQGTFGYKMGQLHVKELPVKADVMTWAEAWRLLTKEYPDGLKGLEDALLKRIAESQATTAINTKLLPPS